MLFASHPSASESAKGEATDIDADYLSRFQARIDSNKWPVRISNMAAESLSFPDDNVDLSIANFVTFLTPPDGVQAVRHMHRILKPGGKAVFTAWKRLPHVEPVYKAHLATRGDQGPPLREIPPQWWLGAHLKHVAEEAGFAKEKIKLQEATVYILVEDERFLAHVLWSYLGPPVTGWLETDGQNWEKAVDTILESFDAVEGFERLDEGGLKIGLVANVVIAEK